MAGKVRRRSVSLQEDYSLLFASYNSFALTGLMSAGSSQKKNVWMDFLGLLKWLSFLSGKRMSWLLD